MIPTNSGRDVIPASGSLASLFFLSKSSNKTADGADNSAPAENPMIPILFGSIPHSLAYARTIRIACWASLTVSSADCSRRAAADFAE